MDRRSGRSICPPDHAEREDGWVPGREAGRENDDFGSTIMGDIRITGYIGVLLG